MSRTTPVFANYSMMHACDSDTQRATMRKKLWDAIDNAKSLSNSGDCFPDEDKALKKQYENYYAALQATQPASSSSSSSSTSSSSSSSTSVSAHNVTFIKNLGDDSVVKDLSKRITKLNEQNYSFLHNKSGEVTDKTAVRNANSNSIGHDSTKELWTRSGVEHSGMVLFNSKQLAQCGRYLAGKQQVEIGSPAERGFCADLFECGAVAPGREKSLWTVHLVCGESGALTKKIWVKSNELEKANYRTVQFMKCRLRDRKLQLIELMRKAAALSGVTSGAAGAGGGVAACAPRDVNSLEHYLDHAAKHAIQRLVHKHKAWTLAADEDRCFSDEDDDDSDMYARYTGGSSKLRDACMSNQLRVSMSKSGSNSRSKGAQSANKQSAKQSSRSQSQAKPKSSRTRS
jgi:hypothetical protein